ncbi:MAG: HAD-IC family P-type ATPase [Fimbriimonadales bacterium]|nr:HAD-IC family P-type ATPase [Fimbriimonadales bacterium]
MTLQGREEGAALAETAWHALPAEQTQRQLQSSPEGLRSEVARERLKRYGPNSVDTGGGPSVLALIWAQINNPLVWVLIGAGFLAIVADPEDGLKNGSVILGVVLVNTIVGFIQEFRANKAIAALAEMIPEFAQVWRDGRLQSIPVRELVPGDVVQVVSGDRVPADLRLFEVSGLQIDEAPLTGESVPVAKTLDPLEEGTPLADRSNMAFGGTLVTQGTGKGVVVATGASTELGRISNLIQTATETQTPLTAALEVIGKRIALGILAVALLMLIVGSWRTIATTGVSPFEAVRETAIFAIALAVGAIPEGLPALVTILLAVGVQRMARQRAIVRKLPAVETLGSTDVICSDKTGTLTRNEMSVTTALVGGVEYSFEGQGYWPMGRVSRDGKPATPAAEPLEAMLVAAALCNDAAIHVAGERLETSGDPTELALVAAAYRGGIDVDRLRREVRRLAELPFDSRHQYMASLNEDPLGNRTLYVKGAPEALLPHCSLDSDGQPIDRSAVERAAAELAKKGLRVLLLGSRAAEETALCHEAVKDLRLLGLVGMIDPPRPEAIEAVRICQQAGIRVKMITGDHRLTAEAIGREIGIAAEGERAITGKELAEMKDSELVEATDRTNVFARVAPEQKLRLVKALQARGHVVAMTGDGVNDAPALKQADIGLAMGITGTSVSKEAADVVLTDDNFATIERMVEEGRRVFDNLIKSLVFLLPTNLGLALILMTAVAFFPFDPVTKTLLLPMLPTQLLWVNMVASLSLGLPFAVEAKEPGLMERPPRRKGAPLMSAFVIYRTLFVAGLIALGAVATYQYGFWSAYKGPETEPFAVSQARTMATNAVVFFQIFYMLQCRSLIHPIWRIGWLSNPWALVGIGVLLVLQLGFVHLPWMNQVFGTVSLGWKEWLISAVAGATVLPIVGLEKSIRARRSSAMAG